MGILADLDRAIDRAPKSGFGPMVIRMNPGTMHALAAECLASYEARTHRGVPIVPVDHIDGWELAEAT